MLISCNGGDGDITNQGAATDLEGLVQNSGLNGVWNLNGEMNNADGIPTQDVFYVVIKTDDTIIEYDYQNDGFGTGHDCYSKTQGDLWTRGSNGSLTFIRGVSGHSPLTFSTDNNTVTFSRPEQGHIEVSAVRSSIAESDLAPLCTPEQLPYNYEYVPTDVPEVFKHRIASYETNNCTTLTGSTNTAEIEGLWDFTTSEGNGVTSTAIIMQRRYVYIGANGDVTNYDFQYAMPIGTQNCYVANSGTSALTQTSGSEHKAMYYKDHNCELVEQDMSLTLLSSASGSNDLLLLTYEDAGPQIARFPRVTEFTIDQLTACD